MNPEALERAYEWYTSGPRQRLQPGGKIVVVMTRWSVKDLTAQLIKSSAEAKADQWELIEFPAILSFQLFFQLIKRCGQSIGSYQN